MAILIIIIVVIFMIFIIDIIIDIIVITITIVINIVIVVIIIMDFPFLAIIITTIIIVIMATNQSEMLRKKVASLEEAIQAKDRENVTNRAMYDNMKGVSRKIKEVSESIKRCRGAWKASRDGGVDGVSLHVFSTATGYFFRRLHLQQYKSKAREIFTIR